MPTWLRSRLVALLIKLLDPAHDAKLDGKAEEWLADNWGHPGFRSYVAQRDFLLVRQLAGGEQLIAPEHRRVWQMTGQRVELLLLGQKAKQSFNRRAKDKEQAIKNKRSR